MGIKERGFRPLPPVALEDLHKLHMAAEKLEFVEKVPMAASPEPPPRRRTVAETMAAALDDVL